MRVDLPFYVERGGDIVIRQPLNLHGVTMSVFLLPADTDRLAALTDRLLNGPAKGAALYAPAAPFVALVCADITRAQGRDEPDRSKGWMPERDVAFWIPLWAGRRVGPLFVPDRLVYLMPYVFVDNGAAVATGREVYGFPKEEGILRFAGDPGAHGFSVDTLVIRRYGVESRAEFTRLLDAVKVSPAERETVWDDAASGFAALRDRLAQRLVGGALMPPAEALVHALRGSPDMGARLVFLKQFRDVEDPERACYQAVVEAPAVMEALHGGALLGAHRITIAEADSHPIVRDLGLSGPVIESEMAVRISIDFTMDRGSVVNCTTPPR